MSVFDIDSKEGKSKDNAHGGSNTEDGVDGWVDSGLLDPLVSSVFRRFSSVSRPGDRVAPLHVESPGHSWVLPHTQLLLSWGQDRAQSQWELMDRILCSLPIIWFIWTFPSRLLSLNLTGPYKGKYKYEIWFLKRICHKSDMYFLWYPSCHCLMET